MSDGGAPATAAVADPAADVRAAGPQLRRNVVLLSAQVLVSSLTLFLVYRHVVSRLGLASLGTWSLVMAFVAFGRVAEFGVSQAVSRFVAEARTRARPGEAVGAVYVGLLLAAGLVMLVAATVLPLRDWIAARLVPQDAAAAAVLLVWAVGIFALSNLAAAYQAAVDGLQRADLRAMIAMVANLVQLGAAWLLVDRQGLAGLAAAQVLMHGVILAGTATVVHGRLGFRPTMAWAEVTRVLRFGLPLQVSAVCVTLLEPTTKMLLGAFATLADVGVYELASRLVQQLRGALIGGLPALTPAVAAMREDRAAADRVESTALAVVARLLGAGVPALIAGLPLVSLLWLGEIRWQFVLWSALLAVGWGLNSLAGPRYYRLLGDGRVRPTVVAHVVMGLLNALAGLGLGWLAGGSGVVTASAAALAAGGWLLLVDGRSASPVAQVRLPWATAGIGLGATAALLALVARYGAAASWVAAVVAALGLATYVWWAVIAPRRAGGLP